MLRRSTERTYLRFELVRFAREHGIRSRAPPHPRQGITPAQRRCAISLKRRLRSWGAARMKRDFSLALSEKALRRVWRGEGLSKRKRRKHKTKQCLREVKKRWRLFEQMSAIVTFWGGTMVRTAVRSSLKKPPR
jgi:hypothetical protein